MGEEPRGVVGEGVGRSPGICLGVAVGVAEERVVIALGGCCAPSIWTPRLPSHFPSRPMESGRRGGLCVGVCVSACVRLAACGGGGRWVSKGARLHWGGRIPSGLVGNQRH